LDNRISEDYPDIVKVKILADKTNDVKQKKDFLLIVETKLNEIDDPDKNKKLNKLLTEQQKLVHANKSLAGMFAVEQNKNTKQTKVTELREKIDEELAALNKKHSLKHDFLFEIYTSMQKFLDYLTSEYELSCKNELKIDLPEKLRTDLIRNHARIKKMAVYPYNILC
jgi:polyribonucleotide nucleotidyltransferase